MGQAFVEDPWEGSSTLHEEWTLRRLECQRQLGGLDGGPSSEALALTVDWVLLLCMSVWNAQVVSSHSPSWDGCSPAGAGCVFSFSLLVWLAWASSQHGSLSVDGLLAWLASPWTASCNSEALWCLNLLPHIFAKQVSKTRGSKGGIFGSTFQWEKLRRMWGYLWTTA